MNVYAWCEYAYYDGLLTFAHLRVKADPASPLRYFRVCWLGECAETVVGEVGAGD